MIKICKYLALLECRSAPICNKPPSSAELLLGKKVKGQDAISEKLHKPQKKIPEVNIKTTDKDKQLTTTGVPKN